MRRLLEALGLDQSAVAAAIGGAQPTVSDWLKADRLSKAARNRLAGLTADPETARGWLAEGAGTTMPPTITKRAVSLLSGGTAPAPAKLHRAIVSLELALDDLRELAGGVPPLTFGDAERAVDAAEGGSHRGKPGRRKAGP